MKRAGIITNTSKDRGLAATRTLIQELGHSGFDIQLSPDLEKKLGYPQKDHQRFYDQDFLFVLGGDGTIMAQAGKLFLAGLQTPIVGINTGRVGFLTEIEKSEIRHGVKEIASGNFRLEKRIVLGAHIGGTYLHALNEFGIVRKANAHLIEIQLHVDDYFVGKFRCDGMLVASPSGSTAYSFSAGGPIISPIARCAVITPICAYSLNTRPIVVDSSSKVRLSCADRSGNCMIIADGRTVAEAPFRTDMIIRCEDGFVSFVRLPDHNFYTKLHKKLLKQTF